MSADAEVLPVKPEENAAGGEEETPKNGDEAAVAENNADAAKNGTKTGDTQGQDSYSQPSGKTVYILNIPPAAMFTMENDLKEIFSQYGEVRSVKRAGVQVEGSATEAALSAYINFATNEAAEAALVEQGREYNGSILDMFILKAGPFSIVADSLPVTMNTDCLKNLLSACGNISKVVKIPGRRTAFIDFEDEEGVKKALSLNGKLMINNIKIAIEKRGAGGAARNKLKNARNAQRFKRPNNVGGNFNRAGGNGPFGGAGGGYNNRPGNMGRGGRGGSGGPRGGRFGGNQGGYGGGGYGAFWGNNDGYNNGDGERPNKRRKPNDWIRQY